jgi:hypothetical protein
MCSLRCMFATEFGFPRFYYGLRFVIFNCNYYSNGSQKVVAEEMEIYTLCKSARQNVHFVVTN